MYIDKTPKLIKSITEFVSDSRAIFDDRCISCSNIIIPASKSTVGYGKHFAQCNFMEMYKTNDAFDINNRNIYRAIKNLKKNIVGFYYDEDIRDITIDFRDVTDNMKIVVENKKAVKITDEFASSIILGGDYRNKISKGISINDIYKPDVVLSEDDVISLVKNNTMVIGKDETVVRITRSIIPGLKKSHLVTAMFSEADSDELFELVIRVERASMTSYHIYTCMKQ